MAGTSEEQFGYIIAILKTAYPLENFLKNDAAIDIWYEMLKDIPVAQLTAGVKKYLLTGTRIPTIADIRKASIPEDDTSEGDVWGLVSRAISRSTYYSQEEYDKLPPDIQRAVGSADNLKLWAMDENYNPGVIQSQVLRSYRIVKERERERSLLSPDVIQVLEGGKNDKAQICEG